MTIVDCIQGTDAWHAARLGKLTASRIADALARTKTGWGASRANLMAELIAERLTGVAQNGYSNETMQYGKDTEAEARAAYEFTANIDVVQVGFILHPTIANAGCSPDGLVGEDGLVEIKCPNIATHLNTLISQSIPGKYVKQVMWQMACSGRKWCDYVSYDSRVPEAMRLWICRIRRDDIEIVKLEREAEAFLAELDEKIETLTNRYA